MLFPVVVSFQNKYYKLVKKVKHNFLKLENCLQKKKLLLIVRAINIIADNECYELLNVVLSYKREETDAVSKIHPNSVHIFETTKQNQYIHKTHKYLPFPV